MKIFSKIIFYIFIIGFLMPIKLFPQVPSLRDLKDHRTPQGETISIAIILDEIRQGIQFKHVENITRHLDKNFSEPGRVAGRAVSKTFLRDYFAASPNRDLEVRHEKLTELWDFDLADIKINMEDSTTAVVSCNLIFHALAKDITKANIAKAGERFVLTKDPWSRWKLRNSRKLFGFLLGILPTRSQNKIKVRNELN